jgi:uncharacterized membrane protein YcjF (UPF0283 family)
MTPLLTTLYAVLTAALAAALALAITLVVLQWRRIGRLGQRIHQQREAASEQALRHERVVRELRDENVRLLAITVHGAAS